MRNSGREITMRIEDNHRRVYIWIEDIYIYNIYIVRELRRVQRERELGEGRGILAQRDFETVSFVCCQFALRVIHGGVLPVASLLSFLSPTFFASLSAYSFPPPFFVSFQSLFQFSDLSRKFRNSTDEYIVPLSVFILL